MIDKKRRENEKNLGKVALLGMGVVIAVELFSPLWLSPEQVQSAANRNWYERYDLFVFIPLIALTLIPPPESAVRKISSWALTVYCCVMLCILISHYL